MPFLVCSWCTCVYDEMVCSCISDMAVFLCWSVGDQSDEGSRQSAVKPVTNATSKVSGTAQPSASAMTTSMSRSASSASLRTAASLRSADAANSPAPTDTRKHGRLLLWSVASLMRVVPVLFVSSVSASLNWFFESV